MQHELAGHQKKSGGRLFMQHEVLRPETSLALPAQLDNGVCLLLCMKCREHFVYHCCQVCPAMHHQTHATGYPPHLHQTKFFLRFSITTCHMTGYHHMQTTVQLCLRTGPTSHCIHHDGAHAICVKHVSIGVAH